MRRQKYGAVRTTVDGLNFASRAEARAYQRLALLVRAGQIQDLRMQTAWPLTCNGETVAKYVSDFTFVDTATGEFHTVDVKGCKTPSYNLKAKWFRACYGWAIEEWA